MALSKIEWTKYTFNLWEGCTWASPACDHCYAEARDTRMHGHAHWGPNSRRLFHKEGYWRQLERWNREARAAGTRDRVFVGSLMDICELLPKTHPDYADMQAARARFWPLVEACESLDFLLLTKRPKWFPAVTPREWQSGYPENVWAMASVENQEYAKKRLDYLAAVPARIRGLSMEPLLGRVDLTGWLCGIYEQPAPGPYQQFPLVHWLITGGETQKGARPAHPDTYRTIRDQARTFDIPFHFKQHGDWLHESQVTTDAQREAVEALKAFPIAGKVHRWKDGTFDYHIGKKLAGRLLDGRTWDGLPERSAA